MILDLGAMRQRWDRLWRSSEWGKSERSVLIDDAQALMDEVVYLREQLSQCKTKTHKESHT